MSTAEVVAAALAALGVEHEERDPGQFLVTLPVAWLGEVDYVIDEMPIGPDRKRMSGLVEADWRIRQGHNLKLTAEGFDPNRDVSHDNQARWSLVYEYTPIQFLQLRGGTRYYDGIPQSDLQNRRFYFLELHGFF